MSKYFTPTEQRKIARDGKSASPQVNLRETQVCTSAGNTTTGNPTTGADDGKIWVIEPENNQPIQAWNDIAFPFMVGHWVVIGEPWGGGDTEVIRNLTRQNVERGSSTFAAAAAQGVIPPPEATLPRHNYTATAAPTVNDDSTLNYSVNSLWTDTLTDLIYICRDATATAAKWEELVGRTQTQTLTNKALTAPDIDGGSIDDTTIGATTPDTGSFTTLNTSSTVVFNEAGADVDHRIESDTDANNLFSDGGSNNVGMGTGTPNVNVKLDVVSTAKASRPAPSMTAAQRDALTGVTAGLLYNTTGNRYEYYDGAMWAPLDIPIKVKNTSGATAAAQDVGYINGSNEYKTTTTANDPNMLPGGCVVLVGAANNSDIYVARRGRVTLKLNANCSIGDKLLSSTTAGQASVSTTMRPEVFAIAQSANAGGAGGTCEALLYTNTIDYVVVDTNVVMEVDNHSTTAFVALINGAPSATSVVYDTISAGAEDVINTSSVNNLGKMVLHNTTRGTSRLISSVNTGTNTIATVSTTDAWADNDSLTIESQTVTTALSFKAIEVDMAQMSAFPEYTREMVLQIAKRDSATTQFMGIHPFETYSSAKNVFIYTQTANVFMTMGDIRVPLINKKFTWLSGASGSGTAISIIYLRGFRVAVP